MKMFSKIKFGNDVKLDGTYWNEVARKMDNFYVDNPFFQYKKRELLKLVSLWGNDLLDKNILKTDLYEESLGYDDFLFDLARCNNNVYGIDISSVMVEYAQKRALDLNVDLHLQAQDVKKLKFPDNFFDLIISNSTLDHFPEIDEALNELYRVLKKNGVLILTLHNKNNPAIFLLYKIMKILNRHQVYAEGSYSLRETKKKANDAGFFVTNSAAIINIPPFLPTLINVFYKSNNRILKKISEKIVGFFETIGNKNTFINYSTGYLVAIRAVKK